ncbi:MAG: hypothetical protein GY809_02210 [Planctomycetes bacterium]|nr:hypothetical protein [Planctomycetota bacterium]
MPAGKRQQSNTVLYTLIIFVAFFIVSTVFAVIFYTKSEDYKANVMSLESQISDIATVSEQSRISTLVGSKTAGSYMNTMLSFHDRATQIMLGSPVPTTTAEAKLEKMEIAVAKCVALAQPHVALELDPNSGLVPTLEQLVTAMNTLKTTHATLISQFEQERQRYTSAIEEAQATENRLAKDKEDYFQQSEEVASNYKSLEDEMSSAADERVANVQNQLNQERDSARNINQQLLKTKAELDQTRNKMGEALDKMAAIEPGPDRTATAYQPDGVIILADIVSGVVHINIGNKDKAYKGLTFSVFDRGAPIKNEDAFKAEIEVVGVAEQYSMARIIKSDPRNPVTLDDTIVNLVWSASEPQIVVLAGAFDLDSDGFVEADAASRITNLITGWGGLVEPSVNAKTDYVIIGRKPKLPAKPTFETLELDPLAQDRYDAAAKKLTEYLAVQEKAQALMIPMFEYSKFLYLIGYTGQIGKAGSF